MLRSGQDSTGGWYPRYCRPTRVDRTFDATAVAVIPDGDGYAAALVNFRFIANDVLTTSEAVQAMDQAGKTN